MTIVDLLDRFERPDPFEEQILIAVPSHHQVLLADHCEVRRTDRSWAPSAITTFPAERNNTREGTARKRATGLQQFYSDLPTNGIGREFYQARLATTIIGLEVPGRTETPAQFLDAHIKQRSLRGR